MWLSLVLIVIPAIAIYVFWVRPILQTRPGFMELYAREESFFAALAARFIGIKQKLTTALVFMAGVAISLHDTLAPIIAGAGVDVTQIVSFVPPKVWPLITVAVALLLAYFRHLADSRRGE